MRKDGRMYKQTDMPKVIVAFRTFVKAHSPNQVSALSARSGLLWNGTKVKVK